MGAIERPNQEYRLTTAEILYHLPNEPHLLQSFVWQDYDVSPSYPELKKFLRFFVRHIEGTLHSVRVASQDLVRPTGMVYASYSSAVH
jgi:uncharacterized protein Usg